jgi:hypothetical protein
MRLLLDTHSFLLFISGDEHMSALLYSNARTIPLAQSANWDRWRDNPDLS